MPPKKRPAAAGATTPTAKRKRVSIGGTSVIGEPESAATHASGRPKRSSIGEPHYSSKTAKNSATRTARSEVGKSTSMTATKAAAQGLGRSPKNTTTSNGETQSPGKPVGRPRKSASAKFTRVKSHISGVQTAKQAREKTTEPSKSGLGPAPKRRGRPKGSTTKTNAAAHTVTPADKPKNKLESAEAKKKSTVPMAESQEEVDGLTANESDWNEGHEDDGKQYWLMKAEPDSRVENGVDVKFSIDDLRNAKDPEGWDGVRNVVARNRMRAMRKGDWAFFYHSNTKVPGVAGIMEIVKEHSIDESAFNPSSPYYDPKSSRDNPKWELVHVRFVRKFSELVPLSELRKHGQPGGPLQDLEMLKQSRLSVSAVQPREWHFILGLARDDGLDDEPEENVAAVRAQIINIQKEVVRTVNGDEIVNGDNGDSGTQDVKSEWTIVSSAGKEDAETDS